MTIKVQLKHIQPVVMAGIMSFLMTGFITWLNLGFPKGFIFMWVRAFLLAWPMASAAAFLAIPITPRISRILLALLCGTA